MNAPFTAEDLALAERRLRIAIVSETYPPEVNGVARTVAVMVDGLRARDHDIELVRPRQNGADVALSTTGFEEFLRPGFALPRYPQLRMGLPAKRALGERWRRQRPDIVHVATEGPLGWSALAAARELAIPVASDFHTNFHAYSGHYGFGWLRNPVVAYLRRFHNRAACTLVPTEELAQSLRALGFARLRVVGRGVDFRTFSPARRSAELRASWGADEGTPVALCVSRFAPEKNFPLVLEAYRAMHAVNPAIRLVLVGEGPLLGELRRSSKGVVVAGRLVNGALSAHYASADAFLFPSVTETFGNVTLEAMASGLAVVAYDYAAARQHIRHGHSGLLAPVGNRDAFIQQARRLPSDPQFMRALGRGARAVTEQLGWDTVTRQFEAVLKDLQLPAARRTANVAA